MNENLSKIIEESIKLEFNMAKLYKFFSSNLSEDAAFWQKLSSEERSHARLIKSGRDALLQYDEFPSEFLSTSIKEVLETNNKIKSLLKEFDSKPPSRKTAFNIAISLEESAGEIHFQRAMERNPFPGYVKIFQDLNKDDKDHARRIREYMNSLGELW